MDSALPAVVSMSDDAALKQLRVCVLQPDYGSSEVDYRNYDPARDLSHLLPGSQVDHVFLNKLTTYQQLRALRKRSYDIFVNLCEGYLEWDIPSIDVVHSLELLELPYTGPSLALWKVSKPSMKYVASTAGVATPAFVVADTTEELAERCSRLRFPLFVKPATAGDSIGIDERSLVETPEELRHKVGALLEPHQEILIEEYIPGRELTVLVAAAPDSGEEARVYRPLEFVFPPGHQFKTYDLKVTEWHPECNVPCTDTALDERLREASRRIFKGFGGVGYGRLDFRLDSGGELFFLEINFGGSVFYPEGSEGSADYVLKHDQAGPSGFLRQIIAEGMARHRRKQKKYEVRGQGAVGFGIYARWPLRAGEVVWHGEERAQRIVTRAWVEARWSPEDQEIFRRYAYPLADEIFILWDHDFREWAPQNHSCEPNTAYRGLNVCALRDIPVGEELTLDYATFLSPQAEPFECACGAARCQGLIRGTAGNSVASRPAAGPPAE